MMLDEAEIEKIAETTIRHTKRLLLEGRSTLEASIESVSKVANELDEKLPGHEAVVRLMNLVALLEQIARDGNCQRMLH